MPDVRGSNTEFHVWRHAALLPEWRYYAYQSRARQNDRLIATPAVATRAVMVAVKSGHAFNILLRPAEVNRGGNSPVHSVGLATGDVLSWLWEVFNTCLYPSERAGQRDRPRLSSANAS